MVESCRNDEDYMSVVDADGNDKDDEAGFTRTHWAYKEAVCPFPGCSEQSWSRARQTLWSVESDDKVLSYLKYHAMQSGLHGKNESNPMSESDIDVICETCRDQLQSWDDTFAVREEYRQHIRQLKKRKADQDTKDKKEARKGAGKGAQSSAIDTQAMLQMTQALGAMSSAMQQNFQQLQRPSSSSGSIITTRAAMHMDATPSYISDVIDDADQALNLVHVQEKHVMVPVSQLLLYKETIARAKESVKGAMGAMMTPLASLRTELGVLSNAEAVLDNLTRAQAS